jgi:hypothetical protein
LIRERRDSGIVGTGDQFTERLNEAAASIARRLICQHERVVRGTNPEIPSLNRAPEKSADSGDWSAANQACIDHLPEEAVEKTARSESE